MPGGAPWPRVSVVTPSYNQAQFIEETIRSVLLQGYPDLEYIVIDGGSADGSVEIIRKYERWLGRWVSEPDRGQSHALNKGFEAATGEFVGWLNSDDLYTPGAVGRAVRPFVSRREVGAVYGDAFVIDAAGKQIGHIQALEMDLGELLLGNYIPQPTVFMRRSALFEAGLLDERLHYAMDYDLWLRLAGVAELKRLDGELASFRLCPGTKSGTYPDHFGRDRLTILDRIYAIPAFARQHAAFRDRAYARIYWEQGVLLLLAGQSGQGRAACEQAVRLGILGSDPDFAAGAVARDPAALRPRRADLVADLLHALPLSASQRGSFARRVWQSLWAISFFGAHSRGERMPTLLSAAHLLRWSPGWLRQRGFRSICAQALLGPAVVGVLRSAKPGKAGRG